jgi:hypothetical protein
MRVACLLFLFALLVALLAKPRPGRARPASRFAIVRIAVLAIRLIGLQIRIGMLLLRYGGLMLLAVIIAAVRRRSRRGSLSSQQTQPIPDALPKYQQCTAQGWPCRVDSAHSQVQARIRQRATPYRSRLATKQGWQAQNRRERLLRQVGRAHVSALPTGSHP